MLREWQTHWEAFWGCSWLVPWHVGKRFFWDQKPSLLCQLSCSCKWLELCCFADVFHYKTQIEFEKLTPVAVVQCRSPNCSGAVMVYIQAEDLHSDSPLVLWWLKAAGKQLEKVKGHSRIFYARKYILTSVNCWKLVCSQHSVCHLTWLIALCHYHLKSLKLTAFCISSLGKV